MVISHICVGRLGCILFRQTTIQIRSIATRRVPKIWCRTMSKMPSIQSVAEMRKPYKGETEAFDVEQLAAREPFEQFRSWFQQACSTDGILEANAMSLATATKDGRPSCRIVLMKGFDQEGFRFFTNYDSRKGQELAENPHVCLVFFWEPLYRSVRIEGRVERLSEEESTKYFHSRPKGSQIGAAISDQSRVISGRDVLIQKQDELTQQYAEQEQLPRPGNWGGYLVRPDVFEFWQGQTTRIHDRIVFRRPAPGETIDASVTQQGEDGWVFERLAP